MAYLFWVRDPTIRLFRVYVGAPRLYETSNFGRETEASKERTTPAFHCLLLRKLNQPGLISLFGIFFGLT